MIAEMFVTRFTPAAHFLSANVYGLATIRRRVVCIVCEFVASPVSIGVVFEYRGCVVGFGARSTRSLAKWGLRGVTRGWNGFVC